MSIAQTFCERLVRDLESNISDLSKLTRDPATARLLEDESVNLLSALAHLQFICTRISGVDFPQPKTKPERGDRHGSNPHNHDPLDRAQGRPAKTTAPEQADSIADC